jgi:hypothetical protein
MRSRTSPTSGPAATTARSSATTAARTSRSPCASAGLTGPERPPRNDRQWTKSHVYVVFDDLPSMWVRADDLRRREVTCYQTTRTLGDGCGPPLARTPTGARHVPPWDVPHWVTRESSSLFCDIAPIVGLPCFLSQQKPAGQPFSYVPSIDSLQTYLPGGAACVLNAEGEGEVDRCAGG